MKETSFLRCARCGLFITAHLDKRRHWLGCPQDAVVEPQPCAYQDCQNDEIQNHALWLCPTHDKVPQHVSLGRWNPKPPTGLPAD